MLQATLKSLLYLTYLLLAVKVAPMRFLVAFWAMLFAISVHAGPTDGSDDASRVGNEHGLLNRISDVGNRISEVGSRITDASSRVEATATALVSSAFGFLGVPYRRGGTSAETGFDCSGFVRSIYQQTAGLLLPRSAAQQAAATQRIDKAELKPGDLVFFNTMRRAFSHVGIYVGNGKFIHAPKPGAEVRVEDLGLAYWARRFDGARRVPEAAPAPAAAANTPEAATQ
jgi:cell wall-associated NlpC family hydrolase